MKRVLYHLGFLVRETGQALDRLGCNLQGSNAYKEQCASSSTGSLTRARSLRGRAACRHAGLPPRIAHSPFDGVRLCPPPIIPPLVCSPLSPKCRGTARS